MATTGSSAAARLLQWRLLTRLNNSCSDDIAADIESYTRYKSANLLEHESSNTIGVCAKLQYLLFLLPVTQQHRIRMIWIKTMATEERSPGMCHGPFLSTHFFLRHLTEICRNKKGHAALAPANSTLWSHRWVSECCRMFSSHLRSLGLMSDTVKGWILLLEVCW